MSRALAFLGTVFALLLTPPVAGLLFCLERPLAGEVLALWVGSAGLVAVSWLVVARHADRRPWLAKLWLVALSLLSAELAIRAALTHLTDWPRQRVAGLGRVTYPNLLAFRPHPFLQFVGQPKRTLLGNEALSIPTPFNEIGFPGPALPYAKPVGTCRIVCLGASTTIPYPEPMQAWLTEQEPGQAFETLNLAHGFYTSANSVVNFALNALDYDPDYVVIHHGWNDSRAAENAAEFRGDYSHAYTAFTPPEFADAPLLRASVSWRLVRWLTSDPSKWEYLDVAVTKPVDPELGRDLERLARTFERNLRTIVDLGLARGITPVLATIPTSTDRAMPLFEYRDSILRLSESVRAVAAHYGEDVVLADVATELGGRNELFRDVAHMTDQGTSAKAEHIGAAILAHWRSR